MSARTAALAIGLALAAVIPIAAPVAAQDPPPPGECPTEMPIAQVQEGQTGIGWTVPRGTAPRPFAVEVVGVFPDGIRPNFDIILIRVSDMPGHQFIENARGIWGGMSGSPVYIDDKLIGAVAWGFSAGPSRLGGVTPIDEMQRVGDLDLSPAVLSDPLRRAIRRTAPATVQAADFGQLRIPMNLADSRTRGPRGGSARERARMRARFDLPARLADRGVEVIPITVGARAARNARPAASTLAPGGNFAASLSVGALDAVGFGTTTLVCGDRVLAFGHDFFLTGATNMGAHDATALDVVDDPTFGPYKLAVAGELAGKVTQDRGAAIAARLDRTPESFLVDSVVSRSAAGATSTATTRVFAQTPRFLVSVLPSDHAFFELLDFIDAFEDGSVGIDLEVSGRREDGSPFTVRFGDRWIGAERPGEEFFDSVSAGAVGVGLMLSWLVDNPFDRITLDDVEMDLDVGGPDRWLIVDVAVEVNGGDPQVGPVCVQRGDDLTAVLTLDSMPGHRVSTHEIDIRVPRQFGALHVRGGKGLDPFFDPGAFDGFDGLLRKLRQSSRADEAVARIVKNGATQASDRTLLDRVIVGGATVKLLPPSDPAC
jgi:hypothetical protein